MNSKNIADIDQIDFDKKVVDASENIIGMKDEEAPDISVRNETQGGGEYS